MSKKGGSSGNQTVTQQNIPDWAMDYAQNTLDMARYYTNNQNYRPSTLDRDYSGIRGYNAQGQPNSQVGQFGLNPSPPQPAPEEVTTTPASSGGRGMGVGFGVGAFDDVFRQFPGRPNANDRRPIPPSGPPNLDNLVSVLPPDMQTGGPFLRRPVQNMGPDSFLRKGQVNFDGAGGPGTNLDGTDQYRFGRGRGSRGAGRQVGDNYTGGPSGTSEYTGPGVDLDGDGKGAFDGAEHNTNTTPSDEKLEEKQNQQTTLPAGMSQKEIQALIDKALQQFDENTITPDEMPTPFQAYDRQRFAAPGDYTLRGEQALANRFGQANPYAGAMGVAERVSNYQSGFTPHQLDLEGPTANSYSNVLSGFSNVNAGIGNQVYGNANQGLLGPQNYNTGRTFQDQVQQFMNPYTDQVINNSLNDINRMRQMADLSTSGSAAKAGAFGGSREALMRAENQRNALDQAARTAGQLRSSGFNTAANLAQQQELQRLGLTAQDLANYRGLQSAGNLQGQSLTAQDVRDTRNLISQGALAAQGYRAQGGLAAQNLGAQSDRDVMNYGNQLQMQGNQLGVEQARLGEQFRQGAAGLNLQGANLWGDLTDKSIRDERQRIADLLAAGQAGDARNQQDLDFIYNEFQRELDYPGRLIDLRNSAISPATGSIVTTTQPRYSSGGLPQAAGAGLATYGMLAGIPAAAPYALPAALAMGLLNY